MVVRDVLGPDAFTSFTFAFVEKQPPYDVRIMQLKDSDIDLGERQAMRGLAILAECIERGEWPGFDGHDQHISYIEMPAWASTRISTQLNAEAGRYTKAEAEREAAVEPWHMSAIHQDDVEDDPVSSRIRMDTARIEALEAENAELRNIADHAQRFKDAVSNCISDTYFSMNSDLATTDAILHVSLYEYFKARRAREGGNADG
ncbi:hypothetical protein BG36_07575 [Aquamicrobium defluvii]|uniref:Uncharacterized protein n=2 Tax=Aquamicrobium defluvii TaxID=69279 RepID=A0A011TF20_9HYPH|nr:hypothetical protein BG36_07575 [Aquamicrobium defluvii]